MSDHYPACETYISGDGLPCICEILDAERENIAQAIEAKRDLYYRFDFEVQNFTDAAQLARNGGRDA